ncbi:hypothetical protein [Paenibacillus aceris]|uniref:Uncharacterized protein n=1 Tax=Paenibacillus aceris TaxID=869555 RepID=A0ABS4HZ54_9BACL|nr:hypothetical protein [Paenibacillus aceris]MBP1963933.1 hypothetical protein [Paenibacillus aceris]NHW34648.1 hypothetical protein [Paenibacillus aceris]
MARLYGAAVAMTGVLARNAGPNEGGVRLGRATQRYNEPVGNPEKRRQLEERLKASERENQDLQDELAILIAHLQQKKELRFQFIEAHRSEFRVEKMCKVMQVSRSGLWKDGLSISERTVSIYMKELGLRSQKTAMSQIEGTTFLYLLHKQPFGRLGVSDFASRWHASQ